MSDNTNPPTNILPTLDASNGSKYVPNESKIGSRIKEARQRKENDLSIEALSRMSKICDPEEQGISRTTLLRYESGAILPGAREIRILCHALNVTPSWLFDWSEDIRSLTLEESLQVLAELIRDRVQTNDPFRATASSDLVRSLMLSKAKEPTKR